MKIKTSCTFSIIPPILDPFITTAALPANTRFVHKRELSFVPLLGQALFCSGHISINRGDRSKALQSLQGAEELLKGSPQRGGSIGIAPEGTRTRDGNLVLPFKKGPFSHLSTYWSVDGSCPCQGWIPNLPSPAQLVFNPIL